MQHGYSHTELPIEHQLCQEPAQAPRKLSGIRTRTGCYSIAFAIYSSPSPTHVPGGTWPSSLEFSDSTPRARLQLMFHSSRGRGPAEAAPVPRGGHLSLRELSSFQSLGSGLWEFFSPRKGMQIPSSRALQCDPPVQASQQFCSSSWLPEKLQTSSKHSSNSDLLF